MAGKDPDRLWPVVLPIVIGCAVLCVIILICYGADYPAGFWEK